MTVARPGILAIFNNVAPGREAEFEEWFQHEHLQERLGVPGFLLGRRYEAMRGEPRYFNFYVTRSAEVLYSADYRTRLNNPTPMTRVGDVGNLQGHDPHGLSPNLPHRNNARCARRRGAI